MKRVLIGSMHHESNSLSPIISGENDFVVYHGAEIYEHLVHNSSITGVIQRLKEAGYEMVPSIFMSAVPNGEVDRDFYLRCKAELLETARKANAEAPLDAITLSLHGSMRVHDFGEAEGPLLEELRADFPNIPIYCSLDTHTTMTEKMFVNADGFVAYKEAPHIDEFETGYHAASLTVRALEEGLPAYRAWVRVPILIAGEQSSTVTEPMKSLIAEVREREKQADILADSYLMGFPWSDNADGAVGALVVARTAEAAKNEALYLAQKIWDIRHNFTFTSETYPEKEAINVAFQAVAVGEPTPIYLSDSGDNPTAGSSSDCTGFLSLLMADARTDTLRNPVIFGGIYDPEAALACQGHEGEELTLTFGAKFDQKTTQPITASGRVMRAIPHWQGSKKPCAIALFRTQGVDLVLASGHIGYTSPDLFRDLGREPLDADLVVCKLGYLDTNQAAVAKRGIMALSKGSTNEDLASIPYQNLRRPIYPLEDNFAFDPQKELHSAVSR